MQVETEAAPPPATTLAATASSAAAATAAPAAGKAKKGGKANINQESKRQGKVSEHKLPFFKYKTRVRQMNFLEMWQYISAIASHMLDRDFRVSERNSELP